MKGTTVSTTYTDNAEVLTELRAKQQRVWSSGDYNRIAALTVAVNENLVASAEVAPREQGQRENGLPIDPRWVEKSQPAITLQEVLDHAQSDPDTGDQAP